MSTDTAAAVPVPAAPTRRERQRQATYDEIVKSARALLRSDEPISLRAIAQEMGITAPALYRYVDGYDQLLELVADAIFDDMLEAMAQAAARQSDDDPAAQLVVSAVAFRNWSLAHPEEFTLIFANRAKAGADIVEKHGAGGARFTQFFSRIYEQVWHRYHFPVPADDELPDGFVQAIELAQSAKLCEFPGLPVGINWTFLRAWSRLYGMVTLEVFGHLDDGIIASGMMFDAMMEDNGNDLALGDDWPRLRALVAAEVVSPTTAATSAT
jgi:AcrR family transcriptional regulator